MHPAAAKGAAAGDARVVSQTGSGGGPQAPNSRYAMSSQSGVGARRCRGAQGPSAAGADTAPWLTKPLQATAKTPVVAGLTN